MATPTSEPRTAPDVELRASTLRKNLTRISGILGKGVWERAEQWAAGTDRTAPDPHTQANHRQAILPLTQELSKRCRGPVLLEGVSPVWILDSLLKTPPPPGSPFFRQRILVLQSDWFEFFDGLSQTDLGDELADPRVQWFVGEYASERLLTWLDERIDDAPPAFVVQNPHLRVRSSPDAPRLFQEFERRWTNNENTLIERLGQREARDLQWWTRRYKGELPEHGPMRVLLPVSRYTTYLQHIATDMQNALRSKGMHCEVIIERDDHTVMSQCSIMRTIDSFDPDLIISINYPRSSLGQHVPKDIPHLCWIQDAMEHLFRPDSGKAIKERDFVVGMINTDHNQRYGYPDDRTRWMPMVASRSKFVRSAHRIDFDAEIAWVTHQSEHPDAMRERLVREMSEAAPHLAQPLRSLLKEVDHCTRTVVQTYLFAEIHRTVEHHFFPNGTPEAAQQFRTNLTYSMVVPYAERVLRHQTAEWAAEIAARRGWRLKLYGEGWGRHPTLGAFAAGPLEHGEALRNAYQRSGVQLHASINQITHQRVSECILSGGLPLSRTVRDSFELISMMIAYDSEPLPENGSFDDADSDHKVWYVPLESNHAAAAYVADLTRLGLCGEAQFVEGRMRWYTSQIQRARKRMSDPITRENAEMFGKMTDLYFASPQGLESLIERAIEDPAWRSDRIKSAMQSLPPAMTAEGFLDEVFDMISTYLSKQSSPGS